MKMKIIVLLIVVMSGIIVPTQEAKAQIPIVQIIKAVAKKVIKAIDLNVQRLQNKTINLQNLQKDVENKMSKLKLDQISDWVKKQKELYRKYYEELQKVKSVIAYYHRVKDITQKQLQLITQYKQAWNLFRQDRHFSPEELDYMEKVYTGILEQSAQNIDQVWMIISEFKTSMSDGERLELIDASAEQVNKNFYDLVRFNQQNKLLSLQRAKDENDIVIIKRVYGLQ